MGRNDALIAMLEREIHFFVISRDLKTLKRLADVSITNTGLEFKLEAGFQLTKAFVSSNFNVSTRVSFPNNCGWVSVIVPFIVVDVNSSTREFK